MEDPKRTQKGPGWFPFQSSAGHHLDGLLRSHRGDLPILVASLSGRSMSHFCVKFREKSGDSENLKKNMLIYFMMFHIVS